MVFPPTPQNASTIVSHWHLSAMCSAIFSGVTEYQDSARQEVTRMFVSLKLKVTKKTVKKQKGYALSPPIHPYLVLSLNIHHNNFLRLF